MSSPTPVRYSSGVSTDTPYGPLARHRLPNPFFSHQDADDFDWSLGAAGLWTATKTGNGTIAHTAGDGGLALFTTNSSTPAAVDICSLQRPAAGAKLTAGNRTFYLARLQVADATNAGFIAGLIQTTTTPFTVTDGVYFLKASGATTLILRSTVGSANTDLAIPSALYPANATNIDLGFEVTRMGDVLAFVGSQLVGYIPQSGTGTQTPPQAGAVARLTAPTLTTAVLNHTLAIRSGTTASTTMTVDFSMVADER